jgi:hypothetical protein
MKWLSLQIKIFKVCDRSAALLTGAGRSAQSDDTARRGSCLPGECESITRTEEILTESMAFFTG